MEKKLIPYSVHLREDIYLKLKEAAKDRKATAMVRDAITMFVENKSTYASGYNKGINDAIWIILSDEWAPAIQIHDESIAANLVERLQERLL